MTIKLYGSRQSSCTQRVLMMLFELGLEYEVSDINLQLGEHKRPEYIQEYHPFGLIPAFKDDGVQLFESRAICKYLLAKYGKNHELNDNYGSAADIGAYEQALSIEYSYFQPTIFGLAYELIFKKRAIKLTGQGDADPAVVARLRTTLTDILDYYEKTLATRQHLARDEFTLVDLYHLPWVPYLARLGLEAEISSRPKFMAWTKRAFARPSWLALSN